MTKTVWIITDENNVKTELTYYHFKKEPKFPSWYLKENYCTVEMVWNVKLIKTFNTFFKCLTHYYKIH